MDTGLALLGVGLLVVVVGLAMPATTADKSCANSNIDHEGGDLYKGGCDTVVTEENDSKVKYPVMIGGVAIGLVGFVVTATGDGD